MLKEKNIVLGISGGIAAYKSASLIRLFRKVGARIKVVATHNALEFVTRTTLETLSQQKIYYQLFDDQNDYTTEHVSLTDWGDVFVVAPATANIIGKYANGIADDALSTSLMAYDKQVFFAPAMNSKMYKSFAVQNNLKTLMEQGVLFIEPGDGYLACGYEGKGRMEEPEKIFSFVENYFKQIHSFTGKKVLVTAGPTYEAIDPVRYIGNYSSGMMGFEIANEFAKRNAEVTLVSGPSNMRTNHPKIKRIDVVSAEQMYKECFDNFKNADVAVMAAAVADYTPKKQMDTKIKKQSSSLTINLKPTNDILAKMGKQKNKNQFLAGFALESDNELENAKKKLQNKNLDIIILNSLKDKEAGFMSNNNKITIINNKGEALRYNLKSKKNVAIDIVDRISDYIF